MPTGSCLCGNIKVAYSGEPVFTAVCHCTDCRKMTTVATYQIPKDSFKVTAGEPKIYTKKSDFGRDISTHFCGDCGTHLFRTGGSPQVEGLVGLRAGVLDGTNVIDSAPKIEVYAERRPPWIKPIDGAMQMNAKYEVIQ